MKEANRNKPLSLRMILGLLEGADHVTSDLRKWNLQS